MNTHHMLCFLLLLFFYTTKLSVGLVKFEVIPPTSSDSPFYVGHLPFWEMINVSIQQSNSRENYIASMKNKHTQNNTHTQHIGLDSVHSSQISHQRSSGLYAVRLQIGTPAITYFLALDTASDIIWLQCSECFVNHACFQHDARYAPLFKCGPKKGGSETCQPFFCTNDQDCRSTGTCDGTHCTYKLGYYDNSLTKGYFAGETFTFDSNYRGNLVFGCGIKQRGFSYFGKSNFIAGVMGMGRGSTSLPKQLGEGVFSHCLPSEVGPSRASFLSFGSDIPTRGFATAPLLIRTDKYKRMYMIGLTAVSINGEPGVAVGNTLAIIDTGTRMTVLAPRVYQNLKLLVNGHFSNNENIEGSLPHPELLCYKWKTQPRNPYDNLPQINFYLGTAVFQIMPEAAFHVNENDFSRFCLWMRRGHTDITLIGARALTNHHIIYDTRRNRNLFLFKPDTC